MGDFNFPKVNWSTEQSSDILSRKFIDTLQKNYMTQMNFSPTRKTNILDIVKTNNTDSIYKIDIVGPIGNSDHDTVIIEVRAPVIPRNRASRTIMLYSKANFKELNEEIEGMDWETILNSRSIEDTWCTFKKEYERLCEKHIPVKRVHEGETRKPPWLN